MYKIQKCIYIISTILSRKNLLFVVLDFIVLLFLDEQQQQTRNDLLDTCCSEVLGGLMVQEFDEKVDNALISVA